MLKEATDIQEQIKTDYEHLHACPEVGFELTKTRAYVKKRLLEMGYQPMDCGKSGIVAIAGNADTGKSFLLRADMDALHIKEEADVSFRSTNGNMHACGHDAHTAMLLGAAKIIKYHEQELGGLVKFMFQPAEEILEGARDMIAKGVLGQPKVDGAMMVHVMTGVPLKTGTIIVSAPGVSAPAADFFEIKIKGKGCHGSMPHMGVDPLTAAAHIIIALQEIQAREMSVFNKGALTIGALEGADVANAIPDAVILKGSMRAFDEDVRNHMKKRLTEIAENVARAFRAEAVVTYTGGAPTLVNDRELSEKTGIWLKETLGEDMVIRSQDMPGQSGGGSEDFAYVSHEVPTIMVALAAGDSRDGYEHPLHHPQMRLDTKAFVYGVAALAEVAMRHVKV
ncbi:MAG: amidohydrolase [Lachnospiraceae bacterium]|nr:amidohydrolase [Lachnospiraceae bacterium]